ncbi:MAG: EAL domain-containing protein [Pseudomonadota bacterium]
MNLRQKTSRYSAAVLFFAGVVGGLLIFFASQMNFAPSVNIWLATALVASLIVHARTGFALSRKRKEIELLRDTVERFETGDNAKNTSPDPAISFNLDTGGDIAEKDAATLQRVKDAIENDRVDLYLQPIVSLPQRKQRYFEAFSRLRNADGSMLRPASYLDAAERANRIGLIDNMIMLRAIQSLRKLGPESQHYRVFCNISPATIYDTEFFEQFTDYLDMNSDLAPRLVFEFTHPAVEIMHPKVEENLQEIARRGFAFSVDHIRRLDHNWSALRDRNFRFVKASSAMLLAEARGDSSAQMRVKAFKERLRQADIDLIVEKVELESHMPEILSLGIDFGQGELFGSPRPASFYLARPDSETSDDREAPVTATPLAAVS